MEDRIFRYALIISFVLHTAILTRLSYSNVHYHRRPLKKVEVTYHHLTDVNSKDDFQPTELKTLQQEKLPKIAKNFIAKPTLPSSFIQDKAQYTGEVRAPSKDPTELTSFYGKKKITIPVLKSEKSTNPKYVNYESVLSKKIKSRAYILAEGILGSPDFTQGHVYITFILASDGAVQKVKILENRTQASSSLRTIGLNSIKESSPFPPFPDLNYPELTFHVEISFRIAE